jgi:uncharacterized protein (TIGR03437 family)
MMPRRCSFAVFAAALLMAAFPGAAQQLPGNSTLQGSYNFRYLAASWPATNAPSRARSAQGTIAFDGAGKYTISGTQENNSGAGSDQAVSLSSSGTYTVLSNGSLYLSNAFISGDAVSLFGGVATGNIVVASSTDYPYADLFVAVPAGQAADNLSAATLTGKYYVASLDLTAGDFAQIRDTFFNLTADGKGSFGNVTINGTAATLSHKATTQTSPGATYTVAANGTGTLVFPAPAATAANLQLLAGSKTMYVARDGSFFVGGSAQGYDIILGVRALAAPISSTPLQGAFFTGMMEYDASTTPGTLFSSQGSSIEVGAPEGLELAHERFNDSGYGAAYDLTYTDDFTFSRTDGTTTSSSFSWVAGAGGNMVIGSGLSSTYQISVLLKTPDLKGSGVFLNPRGIVNAASGSPFTASVSPGEFVMLYGSGLTTQTLEAASLPFQTKLADVEVNVTGTSNNSPYSGKLAMQYVSPGLVKGIVPYSAPTDGSLLTFQVTSGAGTSNAVPVYTGLTSPGIFTLSQNGIGNGAIRHADYSVVTQDNPAKPGEVVLFFLAGLGAVKPAITAGVGGSSDANNLNTVVGAMDFYIDGFRATVSYNGLAPGLAGLYQINAAIPSGVSRGKDVYLEMLTDDGDNYQATIPIAK